MFKNMSSLEFYNTLVEAADIIEGQNTQVKDTASVNAARLLFKIDLIDRVNDIRNTHSHRIINPTIQGIAQ